MRSRSLANRVWSPAGPATGNCNVHVGVGNNERPYPQMKPLKAAMIPTPRTLANVREVPLAHVCLQARGEARVHGGPSRQHYLLVELRGHDKCSGTVSAHRGAYR